MRARLLGVSTLRGTAVLEKFVLHYNEVFSPKVTLHDVNSAPYDGFYLLAYAAAALGDKPITGQALAGAIPRLLPKGEPIDVGPGGIYSALYALGAGKTIDVNGTSTSLDFDPATGDTSVDLAAYCLAPGSAAARRPRSSRGSSSARTRRSWRARRAARDRECGRAGRGA